MRLKTVKTGGLSAIFGALILTLSSCAELAKLSNRAPVIKDAVTVLSVDENDTLELTLEHVDAYDANGDAMTLIVIGGENYTVIPGTTKIIPNAGYVGEISVNIQVKDANGVVSNVRKIRIMVVANGKSTINPLQVGDRWSYVDTFHQKTGTGRSDTSQLRVFGTFGGSVAGIKAPIMELRWSGLSGYKGGTDTVGYLFADTGTGLIAVGGVSDFDTFTRKPMIFAQYPAIKGNFWNYQSLEYNTELKRFFLDTTMQTITCVDTAVYKTVPAGTFRTVHYGYQFRQRVAKTRSGEPSIRIEGLSIPISRAETEYDTLTVSVQLFYAPGVGYVKNETFVKNRYGDSTLVYTKALRSFSVIQKK